MGPMVNEGTNGRLFLKECDKVFIPIGGSVEADEMERSAAQELAKWPEQMQSEIGYIREVGHGRTQEGAECGSEERHVLHARSVAVENVPIVHQATSTPGEVRRA